MAETLTLVLPDGMRDALRVTAEASGKTVDEWALDAFAERISARFLASLPEEYAGFYRHAAEELAARDGRTPAEVIAEHVVRSSPRPRPALSDEEARAADTELMKYAGIWDSGDPYAADNERIDADLAREYGDAHEEEP